MLKNQSILFILVFFFSCTFQSVEMRAAQALKTANMVYVSSSQLEKEFVSTQKNKVKRKKSFKFFKKLRAKFAKDPSEKWLSNRSLIFGSAAMFFFFLGFFTAGLVMAGAYFLIIGLIAGIFAIAYSAGSHKRGIKNWKTKLGLIFGIIVTGAAAAIVTLGAILLLVVLATL